MGTKKINGNLEIAGKLNPNSSGYGILLPDTSTLTDDTSILTNDTWRNIKVNGTQKLGTGTDTGALDLQQGTNVTLSENSGVVTISATDTTYSSEAAAQGGTAVSLVTTGEKYIWNNKSDFSGSYDDLSSRPQINSVTLTGNKSLSDLSIQSSTSLETDVAAAGFTKNAGTITGITMNGTSKGTSGVVDLGTVLTDSDFPQGQVDMTFNATGSSYSSSEQLNNIQVGTKRYLIPKVDTSWTTVGTVKLETGYTNTSIAYSSLPAVNEGVTLLTADIYMSLSTIYRTNFVFLEKPDPGVQLMLPIGSTMLSSGQVDWMLGIVTGSSQPIINLSVNVYLRTVKAASGGTLVSNGEWIELSSANADASIKSNLTDNYGFSKIIIYKKNLTY